MSENLDLVRSIFAAWERGDFSSARWAHPEIEFVLAAGVSAGSGRGLAAMAETWRDLMRAWEDLRALPGEYRELDGERVLALLHASGRGKTSGVELTRIQSRQAALFHLAEGQVRRLVLYPDVETALADLGLAPEAGSA
jgi:ketosteroid isomerase-like protein